MIRLAIRSVIQSDPVRSSPIQSGPTRSNPDFVDADACVTGQKASCVFAGLTVFFFFYYFFFYEDV